MNEKRIAVFQADWPLQSQTFNCVQVLHEHGYQIDLFLWSCSTQVAGVEGISRLPGVQVHDLDDRGQTARAPTESRAGQEGLKGSLKGGLRLRFPRLAGGYSTARMRASNARHALLDRLGSDAGLVAGGIVDGAAREMAGKQYVCLIGIEKAGLVWAGRVAKLLDVPFIYWSLELYTADFLESITGNPMYLHFKRLRDLERPYHRKAYATIVQDRRRAKVLLADNGVAFDGARIFYCPISLLGPPVEAASDYVSKTLGLPESQVVVLFFGQIAKTRYALDAVEQAQRFPQNWTLVMHGLGDDATISEIRKLDRHGRVALSLEMLPADRVTDVIASADVGLVLYPRIPENDRLTAFSSEKMALFMKCGVPFVGFNYVGYDRLAGDEGCGVAIESLAELVDAVRLIEGSHDEFRRRALSTFTKYYDFQRNFEPVLAGIGELEAASAGGSSSAGPGVSPQAAGPQSAR